jgi:hypothetical protein
MVSDKEYHTVYASMDSLLDTRMGTVARIDQSAAADILKDDRYHSRRTNELWLLDDRINPDTFKQLWKDRDIETLKLSMATLVVPLLYDIQQRYRSKEAIKPDIVTLRLIVNTHPYRLTDEEQSLYCDILRSVTQIDDVRLTSTSVDWLTPTTLAQYNTFIWHDLDEWFTIHGEALTESPMPKLDFYAPEILQCSGEVPPQTFIGNAFRMLFAELAVFELMPLRYFSLMLPDDIEPTDP